MQDNTNVQQPGGPVQLEQVQKPASPSPTADSLKPGREKKNKTWVWILIVVLGMAILAVLTYYFYSRCISSDKTTDTGSKTSKTKEEIIKADSEKEATHLSKVADVEDAYWKRGGWFFWNQIEKTKGQYDWEIFDDRVQELHEQGYVYIFPVVFPYAEWDQESCHPEEKCVSVFDPKKGGRIKVGAPCDIEAYLAFLTSMVERYDGDGTDDMPGLMYPIKYWEIMNEPLMDEEDFPEEETKFFVGTADEYFTILKRSYEAIKEEDPQAKVLHAGLPGFSLEDEQHWAPFFAAGAGEYFDIANLHTIDTSTQREDMNVIRFTEFLTEYKLQNKPLWITETQFGGLDKDPDDIEEFNLLLVRATVFALAKGADKILYISNWEYWDNTHYKDQTQQVYENLVEQINYFDTVETIQEDYYMNSEDGEGATSIVGQYKFISDDRIVYVLWGKSALPTEITGIIQVTDIYGKSQTVEADQLILSDVPVFVELSK